MSPSLADAVSRLKLWRCARVGRGVRVLGDVYVVGGGHIEVGDEVLIDGGVVPVELHVGRQATLLIGARCVLERGVSIEAQARVELGEGCHLHAFAKVMDNHFHPVAGPRHSRPSSTPVTLGAGVQVGERAIVLPGAALEDGVRLGPGVVIGRRVRSGLSLVGAPPRVERPEAAP